MLFCFLPRVFHPRKEIIREVIRLPQNEKVFTIRSKPELSSTEIQQLKKQGLKDPVNDITADLMAHNELIPYPGALGGTMGFGNTYVISTKLVRAFFEDGHNGGWMLLEYRVTDGGKISWKVLESYLE
jgi:hypothetical protein